MPGQPNNCTGEKEMVTSSSKLVRDDKDKKHNNKIESNENTKEKTIETTQTKALLHQSIADNKPTVGEISTTKNETICIKEVGSIKPSHATTDNKAEKQQHAISLPNIEKNPDISSATEQSLLKANTTVISADNKRTTTTFNVVKNPYKPSHKKTTVSTNDTTAMETNNTEKETLQTQHSTVAHMPEKRQTPNINIMNTGPRKKINSPRTTRMSLKVEGYAFHDDIIGVAHLKQNGEEAFNLTLRNMIYNRELEDEGFSSYVSLRDKSSGKKDLALLGNDGYPKYLFLSINIHHFCTTEEAAPLVKEQCEKLHSVSVAYPQFL